MSVKSLTGLNVLGTLQVQGTDVALVTDVEAIEQTIETLATKETVEGISQSVAANTEAIGKKADASALEATQGEVDALEGVVATKADASALEATQGEVDALEGVVATKADSSTVETLSGTVAENTAAIATKADASTVETLSGTVESNTQAIATKANASDLEATNTEVAKKADAETVNTALAAKADASALEATQGEVDALEVVVASKADASALEPLATKEGVTAEIAEAIAGVTQFSYSIVSALPETGEAGVIYLVAETTGGESNIYKEYIWIGDKFERFGPELDLSGYQTDEEAAAAVAAINESIAKKADASALEATNTEVAKKADAETVNTALAAKADASALEATQGEVDALEGVVATKADSSTVETLSGTVAENTAAIATKADSSTVETLSGTVAENTAAIATKADSSTVETLSGTVAANTEAIATKANASDLQTTQSEVDALEGVVATKADADSVYTKTEVDEAIANAKPNHQHFEFETEEARTACTTMQDGDTAVVKTLLSTGVYSYTAYVYDDNAWKAMDGNYDASNVYLTSDIQLAGAYSSVGNISKGSVTATCLYNSKGMCIASFLESMLSQDSDPAIVTSPAVTVTLKNGTSNVTSDSNVEVGTTITPGWSASLSAGSYTAFAGQVATGVTASEWEVTLYNNSTSKATATTASGSFDAVVLDDGDVYKVTAKATHDAGAYALTALGKTSTVRIPAGTPSATTKKITAYRKSFWGTKSAQVTAGTLDSALVRGLAKSSSSALKDNSTMSISIPVGAMSVIFAYPKTLGEAKSVVDAATKYDVLSAFTANGVQTVSVASASGSDSIDYYVYFTNFANAVDAANTYTVTI